MVATKTLREALQERTEPVHARLRTHPYNRLIFAGALKKERYAEDLAQRYFLHRTIESLAAVNEGIPEIGTVIGPDQVRSPMLHADLEALNGMSPADVSELWDYLARTRKMLPQTKELIDYLTAITERKPHALVGAFYTFEGAIQGGGQVIAAKMDDILGLQGRGTSYFRGKGQAERVLFAQFCSRMNEVLAEEQYAEGVLETAVKTFETVERIYDALAK